MNSKPKKGGLRLAIIGLFVGIIFGIALLSIEKKIGKFFANMLHEEAQEACGCEFSADSLKFSLLTLSGKATNAKITLNGEDQLVVPKLSASFNLLSHIREKRIAITNLKLEDAKIYQADPSGGTFQFIDHLATPLTEEQKNQNKIRVKMVALEVSNGHLIQKIPAGTFVAEDISLQYQRLPNNDLLLTPVSKKISFTRRDSISAPITIGRLESLLRINKEQISIAKLFLKKGSSTISAVGNLDNNNNIDLSLIHI